MKKAVSIFMMLFLVLVFSSVAFADDASRNSVAAFRNNNNNQANYQNLQQKQQLLKRYQNYQNNKNNCPFMVPTPKNNMTPSRQIPLYRGMMLYKRIDNAKDLLSRAKNLKNNAIGVFSQIREYSNQMNEALNSNDIEKAKELSSKLEELLNKVNSKLTPDATSTSPQ
jgi:ABC-type transporter Mla subunit MlaD